MSAVPPGRVESELLHTYSRVDPFDVLILCVRVAVLTAVTLTVPIVLFPVRNWEPWGPWGHQAAPTANLWPQIQVLRGETEAERGGTGNKGGVGTGLGSSGEVGMGGEGMGWDGTRWEGMD